MGPKRLWSTYLVGTSRVSSPVADAARAYVSDFSGPREAPSLHAVALSDGAPLWSARPDAEGGVKLVGVGKAGPLWWSASDSLSAYDGESGQVVWTRDGLSAPVGASAVARVAATTRGNEPRSVVCLDADNGDTAWSVPSDTLWPKLVTESAVLCTWGMRGALGIAALRLSDGDLRWQLNLAEIRNRPLSWTVAGAVGPPPGDADFVALVFREGTRIYASLADGALAAIEVESGEVVWVSRPSAIDVTGLLEYQGLLYARVDLDIMVLDRTTGERVQVVPKVAHHSLHTPMVAWSGRVARGDGVHLVVLESPVGPEIARVRLTGQVMTPVVAGERLLVAAKSHLTAFELA